MYLSNGFPNGNLKIKMPYSQADTSILALTSQKLKRILRVKSMFFIRISLFTLQECLLYVQAHQVGNKTDNRKIRLGRH